MPGTAHPFLKYSYVCLTFYRFNTNKILFHLYMLPIIFKMYKLNNVLSPLQILTPFILIAPLGGGSSHHPGFIDEKTRLREGKPQAEVTRWEVEVPGLGLMSV